MSLFANAANMATQAASTASNPNQQNVDDLLNAANQTLGSALNVGQNVFNNAVAGAAGVTMPNPGLVTPANNAVSSMLTMISSPNFNPSQALSSVSNLAQIGLTSSNLQGSFSQIDAELRKLDQAAPGAIQAATNLSNLASHMANDPGIKSMISMIDPNLAGHIGDFATQMADGVKQYQDYTQSNNPLTRMGNQLQMKMALNGAQSSMNDIVTDLQRLGL